MGKKEIKKSKCMSEDARFFMVLQLTQSFLRVSPSSLTKLKIEILSSTINHTQSAILWNNYEAIQPDLIFTSKLREHQIKLWVMLVAKEKWIWACAVSIRSIALKLKSLKVKRKYFLFTFKVPWIWDKIVFSHERSKKSTCGKFVVN